MRLKVIVPLLVVAAAAGGYTLWDQARERAAREREGRFATPYHDGAVAYQEKRYTDAEAIFNGMLPELEKDSPDSANLASVYLGLGAITRIDHRNAEAEAYYRKAVAIRTKVSPDDPELVSSLNGLCQTLDDEGREADADVFERQVLAIYRRAPGKYRNDVATTLFSIGDFAMRQHNNQEAESFLKEAVQSYELNGGPKGKNLALAEARLATLYLDERRYPEADDLLQKALAIQTERLSADDPDLARTLQDLAALRRLQGRTSEEKTLDQRASAIFAKAKPTGTETASALLIEQGNHFSSQGEYTQAIDAYQKAVDADTQQFGAESPRVANDLLYLAWLYRDQVQSRITEAEPLFERALAVRQKSLGPEAPQVAEVMSDEALLYFYQGKSERGVSIALRALAIQKKAVGPDSLDVSTTLNRLGLCQRDLAQFPQAEASLQRALAIREKQLPPDHTWIATSLENLASVYVAERDFNKALPLVQRAREIRQKGASASAAAESKPVS